MEIKFYYFVNKKNSQIASWARQILSTASRLIYLRSILILCFCLLQGLPSDFPTKPLCASLLSHTPATCFVYLILLYLVTKRIFSEEFKPCCSSLCRFLQVPLKYFLLGLIMSLSILSSNTYNWCYSQCVSATSGRLDKFVCQNKTSTHSVKQNLCLCIFKICWFTIHPSPHYK
jgi:hypothetical protein